MQRVLSDETDPISAAVIVAAVEVHRRLGPGLLESAYAECLAREMTYRRVPYRREVPLRLEYRGDSVDVVAYRMDFVVDDTLVVELKAQERIIPLYQSQLLTYLRLGRYTRGLLLNFGAARLAEGIKRVVNGWSPANPAR